MQEQPISLYVLSSGQGFTKSRIDESCKRLFDVVISLACLIIFAPVMIIIAALVKLTSSGPVFYRQERVTQHERIFDIVKFRTMVKNAEVHTGPVWVLKDDHRVTPLGKFLRNTHLDELPQLWNVLKGDMSFIGPRPERPIFVQQFKKQGVFRYSDRHLAKAGITGYAQLQCPLPTIDKISSKTRDDLWYIEHWSLVLDLMIFWKTFLHFLLSIYQTLTNNHPFDKNNAITD